MTAPMLQVNFKFDSLPDEVLRLMITESQRGDRLDYRVYRSVHHALTEGQTRRLRAAGGEKTVPTKLTLPILTTTEIGLALAELRAAAQMIERVGMYSTLADKIELRSVPEFIIEMTAAVTSQLRAVHTALFSNKRTE